jgi:hypothetical protein
MSRPHPSAQHRPNNRYLGQFQMPSKRARSVSVISHPLSIERLGRGLERCRPFEGWGWLVAPARRMPSWLLDGSPPLPGREAAARSPAADLPPLPQMCLEAKARAKVTAGRLRHGQRGHHTDDHSPSRNTTIRALLMQ